MNIMNKNEDEIKDVMKKGKAEIKESTKDWYSYIQQHPMQSMLFGVTIYFALKGLLKN